jgi:hypothetical protein
MAAGPSMGARGAGTVNREHELREIAEYLAEHDPTRGPTVHLARSRQALLPGEEAARMAAFRLRLSTPFEELPEGVQRRLAELRDRHNQLRAAIRRPVTCRARSH